MNGLDPSPSAGVLGATLTRLWSRTTTSAIAAAVVLVIAFVHRATLGSGQQLLRGADVGWLSVGLAANVFIWFAGTLTQLGSSPTRLPIGRLFAVQVAGSFLNHLLPAGLGAMAVNVRFLQRSGLTRPAALAAIGLNASATLVTHVLLLAGAVAVAPSLLIRAASYRRQASLPAPPAGIAAVAGLALAVVLAMLLAWALSAGRPWLAAAGGRLRRTAVLARQEVRRLGHVVRDPVRAAQLWLGASASPLMHALAMLAVLRAIGSPVPVVSVLAVYLVMSALAALVPSPGGIGALDVTLVGGLVAVGAPAVTAVAAVLGYRMLTVWVPLLPGAVVFAGLLRRQVI
jgi:uncharacterized membrane protein YbhN (UPF0104 family)